MFKKTCFGFCLVLFIFHPAESKQLDKDDSLEINLEEEIVCTISEQKRGWSTLVKKYGASILSGAAIGILCGLSCSYIEKALELGHSRLIEWFIFRAIRISIINGLVIDAQRYRIDHSHVTIYNSAWVADWLVYLCCCRNQLFGFST